MISAQLGKKPGGDVASAAPLIVFVLLPERTAFNASFVLARRLTEAGYRVAYIGPPAYERHVAAQGLGYDTLLPDPLLPQPNSEETSAGRFVWWDRWRENSRAFQCYQDGLHAGMRTIEDWLGRNPPSLALLDPLMWEFAPPLLKCRIPVVGICSTLTARLDINIPPVFFDIAPETTTDASVRLRYLVAWAKVLLRIVARSTLEEFTLVSTFGPLRYRKYRAKSLVKEHGGSLRYGEYGLRLNVPELVMAPSAIDLPQVVNQRERFYAGSCVDVRRRDQDFSWGAIEKGKPLVYCSLGTYSQFYDHGKRLFSALIDALRNDDKWQAIIHVGDAASDQEFGRLPPHILLTRFAAQLEVLEHASIFVTHGGFGSVREGAFFGVPMIVFPCWLDQFGNAARVVHHRLGVRGHIDTIDAKQMRKLLEQVQAPELRDGVLRMRAIFRHHETCQDGVDWIARFLSATAPPSRQQRH
jgi:UDP:flavonoid glycosyltransferase YjiC (YdhE family)